MSKKGPDKQLIDGWANELRRTGQVVVRPGRARLALFLIGAVLLTLGCLGAALGGDELKTMLVGWVGVLFFGVVGIPTMFKSLFGSRDAVTVDAVGVKSHGVLVPWPEIQSVAEGQSGRNHYVMLGVEPQFLETTSQQDSLVARGMAAANRHLSDGSFVYLPSVLRDPASLSEWLGEEIRSRESSPGQLR